MGWESIRRTDHGRRGNPVGQAAVSPGESWQTQPATESGGEFTGRARPAGC